MVRRVYQINFTRHDTRREAGYEICPAAIRLRTDVRLLDVFAADELP